VNDIVLIEDVGCGVYAENVDAAASWVLSLELS
jgi:hypothetical protein